MTGANFTIKRSKGAYTLIDVLVVIVAVVSMAIMFLVVTDGAWLRPRVKDGRGVANCQNNLKQIGLAFRTWEGDYNDRYPMSVPDDQGGAMESCLNGNSYRAFQVMSNELNNPKIVTCPQDKHTSAAEDFSQNFSGHNVSYLLGIDADETQPRRILSGDRNILSDLQPVNGILNITTSHPVKWTSERHRGLGTVLFADGSVQQITAKQFNEAVANTGLATNRLAIP